MDYRVRKGVFRHILDWCGASEDVLLSLSSQLDQLRPDDQIREVLRAALVARHGRKKGMDVFARLYKPRPS